MGEYSKALSYYDKAFDIYQKTLPANHPSYWLHPTTTSAWCMRTWESTRKHCPTTTKPLISRQKTLPANHPHLATSYNNIGYGVLNMGEYSKALSYYDKALDIRQKTLPTNHPDLATILQQHRWDILRHERVSQSQIILSKGAGHLDNVHFLRITLTFRQY